MDILHLDSAVLTISKHTLWLNGYVAPHQTSVINQAESWEKRSVLMNSPGFAYIAGLHGKWAAVWMNGNRQRLLGRETLEAGREKKKNCGSVGSQKRLSTNNNAGRKPTASADRLYKSSRVGSWREQPTVPQHSPCVGYRSQSGLRLQSWEKYSAMVSRM